MVSSKVTGYAIVCGTIILLGFSLFSMIHPYRRVVESGEENDFRAFYTGAYIVRNSNVDQLYDFDYQTKVRQMLFSHLGKEQSSRADDVNVFPLSPVPYVNPPHFAVTLLPLLLLKDTSQSHLYGTFFICLAALLTLVIAIKNLTNTLSLLEKCFFIMLFLSSSALSFSIHQIQPTVITTLFTLLWLVAYKHNKSKSAGFALAVLSIKPQAAVFPFLVVLAQRQWRMLLFMFFSLAVISICCYPLIGISSYFAWLKSLPIYEQRYIDGLQVTCNFISIRGFLGYLLNCAENTELINTSSFILYLVSLVFIMAIWVKKNAKYFFDLNICITILSGVLFGLHVHQQEELILIIPMIVFYKWLKDTGKKTELILFIGYLVSFTFLTHLSLYLEDALLANSIFAWFLSDTLLIMFLYLWILFHLVNEHRKLLLPTSQQ